MRCRLLTFPLERPSRAWRINSQKVFVYWLMEGLCGHWPSNSWSRERGARPKSSEQRRKVKAKTVRVALSDQQAELFRRAIEDHRKLEKLIDQMRAIKPASAPSTPSKDRHVETEEHHPKCALSSRHSGLATLQTQPNRPKSERNPSRRRRFCC